MSARIAERRWQCDCCGVENAQRGCVKGSPQCACYRAREDLRLKGLLPAFCIIRGRCQFHCTGSPFYEDPKSDYMYRWLDSDAPVKKETEPHTFVKFGLCDCKQVALDELIAGAEIKSGFVPRRIHVVCGRWRLDDRRT